MAGVEAEPGDFFRDVLCDAIELILELNVAAGVRVDNRTDAVAVARQFRDGADVGDHAFPSFGVEAGSPAGVSGRVVPLVVAPIHHGQVRRWEALAWMRLGARQSGYERANLIVPGAAGSPGSADVPNRRRSCPPRS